MVKIKRSGHASGVMIIQQKIFICKKNNAKKMHFQTPPGRETAWTDKVFIWKICNKAMFEMSKNPNLGKF